MKLEESVKTIIQSLDKLPNLDPLKTLYMDSLKVYMRLNNKVVKTNQISIIINLGLSKYSNTQMLLHNSPIKLKEFEILCQEFS